LSPAPAAIVDGALRASVTYMVAPDGYRAGLLPAPQAAEWIARASADYQRWYVGSLLDQSLVGLRNVVTSLTTTPGPIVTGVDIERVEIDPIVMDGGVAHVDRASIWYVTHFAPGTWNVAEVSGVTMCNFDLRQVQGDWRVDGGSCNVSGG
jgi:hypothetical protein